MSTLPATAFRACFTSVCCLCLAACAGSSLFEGGPAGPPFSNPTQSMQSASDSLTIGKSSKADVMATLGAATVINFDSGYVVWVYRAKSRESVAAKAGFVILFSPDGVVRKARVGPAYVVRN